MGLLSRWSAGCIVVLLCAAAVEKAFSSQQARRDASDVLAEEYERRFAALSSDDVEGHFQLALWCQEQGAWDLLRKQSVKVLQLDPGHEQAKLLLELARRSRVGGSGTPTTGPAGPGDLRFPRLVTEEEIQRIRWIEFDEAGEPRPMAIQFTNNVVERFLAAVEGRVGFTTMEERRQFMVLRPNEKVREIKRETQDRYARDIVLKSDPWRLADFQRKVMPIVLGGCATSQCHGAPTESPFALYNDVVMDTARVYTNYIMLHEYQVGGKAVIDRNAPDRSLLLTYGLLELSANLDATYKHPVDIKPFYRGPSDPRYRTIYEWIDSLSAIRPDYGISLHTPPPGAQTP